MHSKLHILNFNRELWAFNLGLEIYSLLLNSLFCFSESTSFLISLAITSTNDFTVSILDLRGSVIIFYLLLLYLLYQQLEFACIVTECLGSPMLRKTKPKRSCIFLSYIPCLKKLNYDHGHELEYQILRQ